MHLALNERYEIDVWSFKVLKSADELRVCQQTVGDVLVTTVAGGIKLKTQQDRSGAKLPKI